MNFGGHIKAFDLFAGKTHLRGDGTRKIGCPALMARRIGIPRFNGHSHGLDRGLQGLTQPLETFLQILFGFLAFRNIPGYPVKPDRDSPVIPDPAQNVFNPSRGAVLMVVFHFKGHRSFRVSVSLFLQFKFL